MNKSSNAIERFIVGYDLRKRRTLRPIFLTSWNTDVRYECLLEKHSAELSALNIFSTDPSTISGFLIPDDAVIVAFDLARKYIEGHRGRSVSVPNALDTTSELKGWQFLGFDVVDVVTQASGLHCLDISNTKLDYARKHCRDLLNESGLMSDFDCAEILAHNFDVLIPEHSPFWPCGIWIKSVEISAD